MRAIIFTYKNDKFPASVIISNFQIVFGLSLITANIIPAVKRKNSSKNMFKECLFLFSVSERVIDKELKLPIRF